MNSVRLDMNGITMDYKVRGFEKISFEQYYKDSVYYIDRSRELAAEEYVDIKLPTRATSKSAGYDFCSPFSFSLEPNQTIKIPTGIKAFMQNEEVLNIHIRSSIGFKYDVVLSNSTGIIDADYYGNENNEGHIWIKLINHGDKILEIDKGDAIAQGIFISYLKIDNDQPLKVERVGGIGSTSK